MDNETKYEYRAARVGEHLWMVRRFPLIPVPEHPEAAIEKAKEVNSWA